MQWDLIVTEDAPLSSNTERQAGLDRQIEGGLVELTWRTNRSATIVGPVIALAFLAGVVSEVEPVGLWVWFAAINTAKTRRCLRPAGASGA